MAWHILLTSPGAEFKVRDELHRLGAWALVPVEFRLSKRKDQRPLKRPVLPGYVFGAIEDWRILANVDGLRSRPVLMLDGRPASMSDREVKALEVLSRPLAALRSPGNRLRPGDRIKIKVGAMADLSACIERITKKGNAVAVFELFGKTHHITVPPDQCEAA